MNILEVDPKDYDWTIWHVLKNSDKGNWVFKDYPETTKEDLIKFKERIRLVYESFVDNGDYLILESFFKDNETGRYFKLSYYSDSWLDDKTFNDETSWKEVKVKGTRETPIFEEV